MNWNEKNASAATETTIQRFLVRPQEARRVKKNSSIHMTYVPISANNPVMPGSTLPRGG